MRVVNSKEFEEIILRRNKQRWTSVFIFLAITLGFIAVIFIAPSIAQGENYVIALLIILLISTIGLFYIIIYPYFQPVEIDNSVVKGGNTFNGYHYEELKFLFMYYFVLPFIAIHLILIGYFAIAGIYEAALITAGSNAFFILIFVFFHKYTLRIDETGILTTIGPMKNHINLEDIVSVKETTIRPIKDFLGYGIRVGPDGAIGIVVQKGSGIQIKTKNDKIYVANCKQPQLVIDKFNH